MANAMFKVAAMLGLAAATGTAARADDTSAALFKTRCAICHGVDGAAQTPAGKIFKAADFKNPLIMKAPDGDLIAIIKSGRNKMPPFGDKLTEDQIKSAVAYIRTLEK